MNFHLKGIGCPEYRSLGPGNPSYSCSQEGCCRIEFYWVHSFLPKKQYRVMQLNRSDLRSYNATNSLVLPTGEENKRAVIFLN